MDIRKNMRIQSFAVSHPVGRWWLDIYKSMHGHLQRCDSEKACTDTVSIICVFVHPNLTSTTDVCPVKIVWASITRVSRWVLLMSHKQMVWQHKLIIDSDTVIEISPHEDHTDLSVSNYHAGREERSCPWWVSRLAKRTSTHSPYIIHLIYGWNHHTGKAIPTWGEKC